MQDLCEKEIRGLHTFFEAWYQGAIDNSDSEFGRIAEVLAPEFTLITSDGYTLASDQLLPLLRSEYGAKQDLKMWVENVQVRLVDGNIVLATYEEHGTTAAGKRATLITAVLRQNPEQQNGLEWVHLHEVRLP